MMLTLMLFVCVVNWGIVEEVCGMVMKYVEDINKVNKELDKENNNTN